MMGIELGPLEFLLFAVAGVGTGVINTLAGSGSLITLPIFIFLLTQMGIVTPGFLLRKFKWAVLLIFVAAAFITPTPDVVNLCLFALPTIVLYLLGVGAAFLVAKKEPEEEE